MLETIATAALVAVFVPVAVVIVILAWRAATWHLR